VEVTIIKKLFFTLEVPDGLTEEELESTIDDVINHTDIDEYDETDWTGHEDYEIYDTYSGLTLIKKRF